MADSAGGYNIIDFMGECVPRFNKEKKRVVFEMEKPTKKKSAKKPYSLRSTEEKRKKKSFICCCQRV